MKLLVINPNTTARMTALIGDQARAVTGGLRTSKRGEFAPPPAKDMVG